MRIWSPLPELRERIGELSSRPCDVLGRRPKWNAVGRSADGVAFTLKRKDRPDGRTEIVLQAYRPAQGFLRREFGKMSAHGFWASPDVPVMPMPPEHLTSMREQSTGIPRDRGSRRDAHAGPRQRPNSGRG